MTQERAYTEAGYAKNGARESASRLLTNANISQYIAKLRKKIENASIKTAADVAKDLSELMDDAKTIKDFSGYATMANRLAKMQGHDEPEQVEHTLEVIIGSDED